MMRISVAVIAAFAVVACSAPAAETGTHEQAFATTSDRPSASPLATGTTVAISFDALATERHPLSRFGSGELQVVTILARLGAADPCYALEPSWLNYCGGSFVQLVHPDGKDAPPRPGRELVFAAVHPSLQIENGRYGVRVTLSAHFDDPAASECRYSDWEPQFGPRPSSEETVEMCRSILVITDVEPAS